MREIVLHSSNIFTPIIEHNLHYFLPLINKLLFGHVKRVTLHFFILFTKHPLVLLIMFPNIQGEIIEALNRVLTALFVDSQASLKKHLVTLLALLDLAQLLDDVFSCTRT